MCYRDKSAHRLYYLEVCKIIEANGKPADDSKEVDSQKAEKLASQAPKYNLLWAFPRYTLLLHCL